MRGPKIKDLAGVLGIEESLLCFLQSNSESAALVILHPCYIEKLCMIIPESIIVCGLYLSLFTNEEIKLLLEEFTLFMPNFFVLKDAEGELRFLECGHYFRIPYDQLSSIKLNNDSSPRLPLIFVQKEEKMIKVECTEKMIRIMLPGESPFKIHELYPSSAPLGGIICIYQLSELKFHLICDN